MAMEKSLLKSKWLSDRKLTAEAYQLGKNSYLEKHGLVYDLGLGEYIEVERAHSVLHSGLVPLEGRDPELESNELLASVLDLLVALFNSVVLVPPVF